MAQSAITYNDGGAGGHPEGGRQPLKTDTDDLNVLIQEDDETNTGGTTPAPLAIRSMAEADEIIGGLSDPSKMPCRSWGISTDRCRRGKALRKRAGAICTTCYGDGGRSVMPNVQVARERRYERSFDPRWIPAMVYRLKDEESMRWMDTGDLDGRLFGLIMEVGRQTPNTRHWIATRERELVRAYLEDNTIPANVCIRISSDFIDQTDNLPWVDGCTVATVTRDHQVEGAHNCPVTWSDDKTIDSCDAAGCRACWEVRHVNYRLHTENGDSAFCILSQADAFSLAAHIDEPVPEVASEDLVAPLELSVEQKRRMSVTDILELFYSRLEKIRQHGGFFVDFAYGKEILYFTDWITQVERNSERLTKALTRMSDIYREFRIPDTTAQMWKRVVGRFDPEVRAGRITMDMLAQIGISKLDVLVGIEQINDTYWSFDTDGAILLSSEITEGPFDVREITIKDLRERRATLLYDKVLRETPVQIPLGGQGTMPSSGAASMQSNAPGPPIQQQTLNPPPTSSETPHPTEPAGDQGGGTRTEVTATVMNDVIDDDTEQRWKTRTVNGRLVRSESTTSAFEVTPTSPNVDAYAILEAPSLGDGSIPARQLLWYDGPTGRTLNFPLS
jgi:hypothetical protein